MKNTLKIGLVILTLALSAGAAYAQSGVHTPAIGSPERKAILYAVRIFRHAPNEVYTPRIFRVSGRWAYVAADDPNEPGVDTAAFDVVLRRTAGKWMVVDQISHVEGSSYASEVRRIRRKYRSLPAALLRS